MPTHANGSDRDDLTPIGVSNPYALAEMIAGRKFDWKNTPHSARILEETLQTPYQELFDPKFDSPLYLGMRLNADFQLERQRPALLDVTEAARENDLEFGLSHDDIRQLADLKTQFDVDDTSAFVVTNAEVIGQRYVQVMVRLPEKARTRLMSRVFSAERLKSFVFDDRFDLQQAFFAPWLGWQDLGRFFNEATEYFDPVQGAVPNCYFIAALSAVAWAKPLQIANMTRAIGQGQNQFKNMIRFYTPDSGGAVNREIEVTDLVPIDTNTGGFLYARSSEANEIWPGVYEKAYAKLLTNTASDYPNIPATGFGDPVWATAQLTGGRRQYFGTAGMTADQIWNTVRNHSMSYRTFNPMTAWTYPSGEASPNKVVYSDANLVANHAYTILGWEYHNGRKYIILRNPWGVTEATHGSLNSTWIAYDISWWRPVNLATIDGTFALEASVFKQYFAGFGVVV